MTKTTDTPLLPCPFCGGTNVGSINGEIFIQCSCGAQGPVSLVGEEAEQWNRRAVVRPASTQAGQEPPVVWRWRGPNPLFMSSWSDTSFPSRELIEQSAKDGFSIEYAYAHPADTKADLPGAAQEAAEWCRKNLHPDALAILQLSPAAQAGSEDARDAARWREVERNPFVAVDRILAAVDPNKPGATWKPALRAAFDAALPSPAAPATGEPK